MPDNHAILGDMSEDMMTVNELPEGYRWATAEEAEAMVCGSDLKGVLVQRDHGQCDVAVRA